MEQNEVKKIVAELIQKGTELSEIQKILADEHNVRMTFLDLRLMASELENIDWDQFNKEEEEAPSPEDLDEEDADPMAETQSLDTDNPDGGRTTVEINKIARPGALVSGSVSFGSGAKADWMLDQTGRLALEPKNDKKPTQEDIAEFQEEIQKALASHGM